MNQDQLDQERATSNGMPEQTEGAISPHGPDPLRMVFQARRGGLHREEFDPDRVLARHLRGNERIVE